MIVLVSVIPRTIANLVILADVSTKSEMNCISLEDGIVSLVTDLKPSCPKPD